jgi:hypothetical protein
MASERPPIWLGALGNGIIVQSPKFYQRVREVR